MKFKMNSLADLIAVMQLQSVQMPTDEELRQGYPKPKLGRARQRVALPRKPVPKKTTAADLSGPLRIKRVSIS